MPAQDAEGGHRTLVKDRCEFRVTSYDSCKNKERSCDPQGLEGQLNDCLGSGGIDSALFEETVLDRSTGHVLNTNLIDYKWRTFRELPPIDNVVLETPFPTHRFHAIGVGEISTAAGPVAVLMAVSNALGMWLHEYPLTPDKVLRALGKGFKPFPHSPT